MSDLAQLFQEGCVVFTPRVITPHIITPRVITPNDLARAALARLCVDSPALTCDTLALSPTSSPRYCLLDTAYKTGKAVKGKIPKATAAFIATPTDREFHFSEADFLEGRIDLVSLRTSTLPKALKTFQGGTLVLHRAF